MAESELESGSVTGDSTYMHSGAWSLAVAGLWIGLIA